MISPDPKAGYFWRGGGTVRGPGGGTPVEHSGWRVYWSRHIIPLWNL